MEAYKAKLATFAVKTPATAALPGSAEQRRDTPYISCSATLK